jgi:hypothetical protein
MGKRNRKREMVPDTNRVHICAAWMLVGKLMAAPRYVTAETRFSFVQKT